MDLDTNQNPEKNFSKKISCDIKTIHIPPPTKEALPPSPPPGIASSLLSQDIQKIEKLFADSTPYRISGELTGGAMALTLLALDTQTNKEVVIKCLFDPVCEIHKRFLREVDTLKKLTELKHEFIVQIKEAGFLEHNRKKIPYYVMEYFGEGTTLTKLQKSGSLSLMKKIKIIDKLAQALSFAHKQGIIHRDIKPENILVNHHLKPKLIDFGIAKLRQKKNPESESLTKSAAFLGTVEYMAPEQMKDSKKVTEQSDIFSLGQVLYFLLTGKTLVISESLQKANSTSQLLNALFSFRKKGKHDFLEGYSQMNEELSRFYLDSELQEICYKALAWDLQDRYKTAEAFSQDLKEYLLREEWENHFLIKENETPFLLKKNASLVQINKEWFVEKNAEIDKNSVYLQFSVYYTQCSMKVKQPLRINNQEKNSEESEISLNYGDILTVESSEFVYKKASSEKYRF